MENNFEPLINGLTDADKFRTEGIFGSYNLVII